MRSPATIWAVRWLRGRAAALLALALIASPALAQQAPAVQQDQQPPQTRQAAPARQTPQAEQQPPAPQPAQSAQVDKAGRALEQLRIDLEAIRKEVAVPTIAPEQLAKQRNAAEAVRIAALAAQAELRRPLAELGAQLKKLGDQPGVGQSEPDAVAAERKRLNATLADLEGISKQLGVVAVEADQLASAAASLQRDLFISRVFEPSRSILNPVAWYDVFATIPTLGQRTRALIAGSLSAEPDVERRLSPGGTLALASAAALLAILFAWGLNARISRRGLTSHPSHLQRLWRAVWVTVFTVGLLVVGFVVAHLVANVTGGISPRLTRVLVALERGVVSLAANLALAWGILAPRLPAWRLVDRNDTTARTMAGLIAALAFFFALDLVVSTIADVVFLPVEFTVGWNAGIALLMALLMAVLLRVAQSGGSQQAQVESGRAYYFGWTVNLLQALWIVVTVSVLGLVLGYVAFAHFIITNVFQTAGLVSVLYLLHHLMDALVVASLDARTAPGRFVRTNLSLSESGARRVGLFLSTLVDLALLLGGIPLILGQWALTWIDYSSWLETAFFGFKVGDITIEPDNILIAIGILVAGFIAARLFRLWLDRRVLARTEMDSGLRNSILTGTSYATIIVVVAVAVSAAGLDFSNLAIIVGALSVGIGLGLQSIVNNFVSGLILLAERPIQVGDWISVTGGEGTVKKINVRSTEIETFDRGSVIIPNSSLITEAVLNWTHTDAIGRARIPIGVSYDADPEKVQQVLLECGRANKRTMSFPEPFVLFVGFGDSSLDFELRVFIPDVNYVAIVGSELRFAIFKALKEAGIEIPYPQRDVHVRTTPPPPVTQPRKRKA